MIIGHGDIASVLNDREGAIFFASGVSNSQENRREAFERERKLLEIFRGNNESLFYFSTLSINLVDTAYTRHKHRMEELIKTYFTNYNIIRIGNITWGKNPHTFINYFKHCIENDLPYTVKDEYRYLIDERQLLLLTDNLPLTGGNQISVSGNIVKVSNIVDRLIAQYEQGKVLSNNK